MKHRASLARLGISSMAIGVVAAAAAGGSPGAYTYPETRRVEVVDDYHGTQVVDPFRWLETPVKFESLDGVSDQMQRESQEVANWVEAQNKLTFGYLEQIPERDAIKERLTKLWDFEKFTAPFKAGGRYYFTKNNGLQNQYVLHVQDSLDAPARVLLDPNTLSPDGTTALAGLSFSDDGRWMAYALAEAGSDWQQWRIKNIETGEDLPDLLRWVKFSGTSWTPDSRGFFYSRFDEPAPGQEFQSTNLYQKVYYHRVGTAQSDDVLVYKRDDEPEWGFSGDVTEDGRYLIITVAKGTDDKYRVLFKDLLEPYGMPVDLVKTFDNEYSFLGNDGPVFYFKTDVDAPLGRVVAMDTRRPDKANWREVVPQAKETLAAVSLTGNMFICSYLKDATTAVRLYSLSGVNVRNVEFPGLGTAGGFGGKRSDTETFYSFASFVTPPSNYRYDILTGESKLLQRAKVDVTPDDYEVKQVFYTSKDGTKVPMFIVHKRGMALDGNNPTLLYGYGGFNIPLTPAFSISRLQWVEMGGVFVVANLRGGGEYGEEWHKAGTKLNKQNVFDDFIAAAEYLIANKYTQPSKLAIQGGSNGGLLVGACTAQRPDLFGAALPAVGVMDMLRFQKFTAGRYWVDDYGSSDNADEFKALMAYSPYHNLKEGVSYPATLVTTADTDDRVVPGHSFKYAAKLQCMQAGPAPVMIRIETKAGHGAGKPTAKIIEEVADQWAFLVKNLGMKPTIKN